ncbi:MAG: hypothetical protein LLG20_27650 [Acidobacteriales bacterium]|nr:hypothetical protein [Terriglobales bacterium]
MTTGDQSNWNTKRPKGDKARPTISAVLEDGSLIEMLYRPEEGRTLLCVSKDGEVREEQYLALNGENLVPYSPNNNLLAHEVVLFPSEPLEYGSTRELVGEIQTFIHAHVDISSLFEQIASYYVLFSWVYDSFNELPYLRVRGDAGSGKTRCLITIGSLCYKPIFASGASTVSPIFRILDSFRGTLIVDEGDFRFSDERADIVKILNNGNAGGFPVLRSESQNNKEFSPKAFSVFGPKIIATRNYFEDRALETRCLTEETGGRKLRNDIPLNLGKEWKLAARQLRNKLLMFRFKNFGKCEIDAKLIDRTIEPRLAQLFAPLLTVIDEPVAKERLLDLARDYHRDLIAERSADAEAQVLEVIRDLLSESEDGVVSVKRITASFVERHADDYDRKITPKWIGSLIRRNLQLRTHKSHGIFVLSATEAPKLDRLYEKYGIEVAGEALGATASWPSIVQPDG